MKLRPCYKSGFHFSSWEMQHSQKVEAWRYRKGPFNDLLNATVYVCTLEFSKEWQAKPSAVRLLSCGTSFQPGFSKQTTSLPLRWDVNLFHVNRTEHQLHFACTRPQLIGLRCISNKDKKCSLTSKWAHEFRMQTNDLISCDHTISAMFHWLNIKMSFHKVLFLYPLREIKK